MKIKTSWRIVAQAIDAAISAGVSGEGRKFLIDAVYDMARAADYGAAHAELVELYMFISAIAEEQGPGVFIDNEQTVRLREILNSIQGAKNGKNQD